jgi:tetratricopeptide (TPR) repeat protein
MKQFLLILLIVLFSIEGQAQDAMKKDLFEKANALFEDASYREAIDTYLEIEASGFQSAELYYNLGNAYLKNNELAKSILYLERALVLNPGKDYILKNLEIARKRVDTDIIEIPVFLPIRIWQTFSSGLSPKAWLLTELVLLVLLLWSIYKWRFSEESSKRLKSLWSACMILALLIVAISAGFSSENRMLKSDLAIIKSTIALKSGADERANDLTNLSEGLKVRILDEIAGWYKVQLMNKEEGWIRKTDVYLV